jgi:hypothetical protein
MRLAHAGGYSHSARLQNGFNWLVKDNCGVKEEQPRTGEFRVALLVVTTLASKANALDTSSTRIKRFSDAETANRVRHTEYTGHPLVLLQPRKLGIPHNH